MGRRYYRNSYRSSRSRDRGTWNREQLSDGDKVVDFLCDAVVAAVRGVFRAVRSLWRYCFATRIVYGPLPSPPALPGASPGPHVADTPASTAPARPLPAAQPSRSPMPYRRVQGVLTRGEQAFWHPLVLAVAGRYSVLCKVRLQDVVQAPAERWDEWRWFRKIRGYHVDFVVCDRESFAPLLVVEHDDRSHRRKDRKNSDNFKDQVLADAGLPVYRVPAQQAYAPEELLQCIQQRINSASS